MDFKSYLDALKTFASHGNMLHQLATATALLVTLCGYLINEAWARLRARRQFTANLLGEWGAKTGQYRKTIEELFPGLFDSVPLESEIMPWARVTEKRCVLDHVEACRIYRISRPGSLEWDVRFAIIELLSYMEFVSEACTEKLCDPVTFWRSYGGVLEGWWREMKPFAEFVGRCRGLGISDDRRQNHPWANFETNLEKLREQLGNCETVSIESKDASHPRMESAGFSHPSRKRQ